jgi:hypothetical protein
MTLMNTSRLFILFYLKLVKTIDRVLLLRSAFDVLWRTISHLDVDTGATVICSFILGLSLLPSG